MATTMSCIIVTTLIVVSLANLLLLVHVIMHSAFRCNNGGKISSRGSPPVTRTRVRGRYGKYNKDNNHSVDNNYIASLVLVPDLQEEVEFLCGVALFHPRYALTAAHCVKGYKKFNGRLKIATLTSSFQHNVDQVVIHDRYAKRQNDIALIKISPIITHRLTIPDPRTYKYNLNASAKFMAVGQDGLYSSMDVKLLGNKNCGVVEQQLFCAGGFPSSNDLCDLDPGGILVSKDLGFLIGIMWQDDECFSDGRNVGLFTRIAFYESWIRKNIKLK